MKAGLSYRHLRCSHSHCSGCSRNPTLDHGRDHLHGARDIDHPLSVARRHDRGRHLDREAALVVGAAHDAGAVDRCGIFSSGTS